MRQRDAKADGPAIILHEEDVAIDPKLFKQSIGRFGEMIERIAVARGGWRFALPEAGVVRGDQVETVRQERNQGVVHSRGRGIAVQQHDGRGIFWPRFAVEDADALNLRARRCA
jgi:hypothetical protein